MDISKLIDDELLNFLQSQYQLDWEHGVHGFAHWKRVRENGLKLAAINGANTRVIEAFAFTHDIMRVNDGADDLHGWRASQFIRKHLVPSGLLVLTSVEFDQLCEACEGHTDGRVNADLTVQTCWDADRLDLMRVSIWPEKRLLCTDAARRDEMIQWAVEKSLAWARKNHNL
jgi:uncharacterized protein